MSDCADPSKSTEVVAEGSGACGSGETLQSLGVQGKALAALLQRPALLNPSQSDPNQMEDALEFTPILDTQGLNAMRMRCKYCGCSILPESAVKLRPDVKAAMPPMPKKVGASTDGVSGAPENVQGFWHVTDKFDFDNMGATKAADASGMRFIICGECDLGPIGWFKSDKDMYVSVSRVSYE